MKKYLALGLISTLLFTSCSVDWNDTKDKKVIIEIEKNDDLFKKKQECNKYYKEIIQYYRNEIDGLVDVFYSPNKKTCFVTFLKGPIMSANYDPKDPVMPVTPMVIIDWLTKEQYYIVYSNGPEFSAKIKELKGE